MYLRRSLVLTFIFFAFFSYEGICYDPESQCAAHHNCSEEIEYTPFDGFYNNFAHPDWGAAETPLIRILPHAYSDGVYQPSGTKRQNPLTVASIVFDGVTGRGSVRNRTAFLVFFGQQMVEEILDAQGAGCPIEYFNIPIPKDHPILNPTHEDGYAIPLLRTRYDTRTGFSPSAPREQLNEVSAFFDGSLTYGPNKAWSDVLRSFKDGLMQAANDTDPNALYTPPLNRFRLPYANPPPPRDHYLKPVRRFYTIGNPRGNENPFLLTMGIMWFRYHNFKARQIKHVHPKWNDEKIFNEARKWVIAVHQKIVYFDWLKAWLSETLPPYNYTDKENSYNPNINPGIAAVFQSAAMRFGHTLVPPGVYRRNKQCEFRTTSLRTGFPGKPALRTCNTFWNPTESIQESDIDEFIMGMTSQIAEKEDNIVTPDLHGDVFGSLDFSRRDLMAVNIQRGRDHGLTDYNTAREILGLPRMKTFRDINPALHDESPEKKRIFDRLHELHNGSLDDLDIWPMGMLETTERGPGPLFRKIILDQFTRIRNGDRFWFENWRMNRLFTEAEVKEIYNTTIRDVILAVTKIEPDNLAMNPFFHYAGDPCPQPRQLNQSDMENCTNLKGYDYFHGSEAPYILTIFFILCSVFPFIGLMIGLSKWKERRVEEDLSSLHQSKRKTAVNPNDVQKISLVEWVGPKEGERVVVMEMNRPKKLITLKEDGKLVRTMELTRIPNGGGISIYMSSDSKMSTIMIRVPKEYDMVLKFSEPRERQNFYDLLKNYCLETQVNLATPTTISLPQIKSIAVTKAVRQKLLEQFFNSVFSHALKYETGSSRPSLSMNVASEVSQCELTKSEFAEALSMNSDSLFITNMFSIIDKNDSGFISFREFLDFFVIFSKGTADEKARLLFDMHDVDRSGYLSKEEFKLMLSSMVEIANEKVEVKLVDALVNSIFTQDRKSGISFTDFKSLLETYKNELSNTTLNMQVGDMAIQGKATNERIRQSLFTNFSPTNDARNNRLTTMFNDVPTIEKILEDNWKARYWSNFCYYMSVHCLEIFWVVLYTLVVIGIFVERAYYFSVEREHTGLRRICGYGVTVTRGAASAQMFCYSTLLLTMCRNCITFLRGTFLNRYVPFDSAVDMHKYIAWCAGLSTIVHIIGHCFNFYYISTQPASDLSCLFRNYFYPTDYLPKFQFWAWNTLTGVAGLCVTVHFFLIFVFSSQYARGHLYRGFWIIHNSYPLFYILILLHGAGRLIQAPFMYYFLLGPLVVFIIDQLMSVGRKKIELSVVEARLLPSDVTMIKFKRPYNFDYKSGQWIRIACIDYSSNEYHPLTITSAPHEEFVSVHVRAVGPWTIAMRKMYDPRNLKTKSFPKVYLDGPFGEGHEDWHKYDVAILIGAGIGVTPFASILKDLAHKISSGNSKLKCKKVYFIWVTRTQRHYEWLTDIIHEIEKKDVNGVISAHIFITQFKERFDFRTTMLYICERYFQKISNRSLFTGLQSITHFGRPDFVKFFQVIKNQHPTTNVFGVFTCGPPPITQSVEKACAFDNQYTSDVLFIHHHENF